MGLGEMGKSIPISWDSIHEGFKRAEYIFKKERKKKKNGKKAGILECRNRKRMRDETEDVGKGQVTYNVFQSTEELFLS